MLKMGAKEPLVRANYNRAASQKSGTNTAIFSHRIRPGDTSPNGVVIGENGSGLRGASSITDHSGNPASGEWFPDIIVGWKISREQEFYIVQAAVTSVPINGNAYQAGETIEITLEASGPVFVDDKSAPPYVLLTAGNRRARAHYHAALSRAAGANKLIFTWRVPEDHEAIEKTVASTPLNRAGSVQNAHRITGPDGRRIDPSMPAIWRNISGVEIADYGRPHIVSMGFTSSPKRGMNYRPGEVVEVTLSASSPLRISEEEQPRLTLRVANTYHTARYDEKRSRAAGIHKLVFVWEVPRRLPIAGKLAIHRGYLRDAGGTRSWSGRALLPSLPGPVHSGFTPGVQTAKW